MNVHTREDLDYVFGKGSVGETAKERATTSPAIWIRSQNELGHYQNMAALAECLKPQPHLKPSDLFIISSSDAFRTFGLPVLDEAVWYGSAVLENCHPAFAVQQEREKRGWTQKELATYASLTLEQIVDAEDENSRTHFVAVFVPICKALELDPLTLGL